MRKQDLKQSPSFPADSPVSPSPPQESGGALRMNATCGRKCAALLPNCGPVGCLGKMLLASSIWGSTKRFLTCASDKSTCRDAANLDVFLSDNGIFRKRNKDGTIWSLSLSAAVFYLTPAASEGYRSTLKPAAFRGKSPSSNLSAQVIHQEQPLSEKAALNPDWVEWLMGFPQGWTDVSSGPASRRASPA